MKTPITDLKNATRIDLDEEKYNKIMIEWVENYYLDCFFSANDFVVTNYIRCPAVGALLVTNHYRILEKEGNPPANNNPWREYYIYINACKVEEPSPKSRKEDFVCE